MKTADFVQQVNIVEFTKVLVLVLVLVLAYARTTTPIYTRVIVAIVT